MIVLLSPDKNISAHPGSIVIPGFYSDGKREIFTGQSVDYSRLYTEILVERLEPRTFDHLTGGL